MRSVLPTALPNGHVPAPPQVFVLSGICQDPHFRLRGAIGDFCLVYLGAPALGELAAGERSAAHPEIEGSGGEPYFILRRGFDAGEAVVALRIDWEGIFTLLANDDGYAEQVYREIIEPSQPEEVNREWSVDASTLRMFTDLLSLA